MCEVVSLALSAPLRPLQPSFRRRSPKLLFYRLEELPWSIIYRRNLSTVETYTYPICGSESMAKDVDDVTCHVRAAYSFLQPYGRTDDLGPEIASQLHSGRSSSEYTDVRKCTRTASHVGNSYGLILARPGYPSPLIDRLENKAK